MKLPTVQVRPGSKTVETAYSNLRSKIEKQELK